MLKERCSVVCFAVWRTESPVTRLQGGISGLMGEAPLQRCSTADGPTVNEMRGVCGRFEAPTD